MNESKEPRAKARLYVAASLAAGAVVRLTADQAHYAGRVMRLGVGDRLSLFNGRDGEWRARVQSVGRKGGEAIAEERLRAQTVEPAPILLFAPLKKSALDVLVAKATELGVAELRPVSTRRTVAARVNLERLRAQAVEAAEQCERLTVPDIRAPEALDRALGAWDQTRTLFVADETGGGIPLADVLSVADRACSVGCLVGPEGGFERSELDALGRLPFVTRVALGPRILRAETAALVVLACWQSLAGDGRAPSPRRD